MDHEQLAVLAIDRHDLQRTSMIVVSEIDNARRACSRALVSGGGSSKRTR
jgi:hypothetical protein